MDMEGWSDLWWVWRGGVIGRECARRPRARQPDLRGGGWRRMANNLSHFDHHRLTCRAYALK